jgi:hypothetical protein
VRLLAFSQVSILNAKIKDDRIAIVTFSDNAQVWISPPCIRYMISDTTHPTGHRRLHRGGRRKQGEIA